MTRLVEKNDAHAAGDRLAAALGFSYGPGEGRAAAVHRLVARVQPSRLVRPLWQCRRGLLGFAASRHGSGADRAARLVRRPEAARARRAAPPALREALGAALAELRRAYGEDMSELAMGTSACRGLCKSGVRPDPGAARLARGLDPDRRGHMTRSIAARARSATTPTPSRSATAPGCGSITDLAVPGGCADDGDTRPIRQSAVGSFCRSAAPVARLRLAGARPIAGGLDLDAGSGAGDRRLPVSIARRSSAPPRRSPARLGTRR